MRPGLVAGLLALTLVGGPSSAAAHPLGNFSISQYTGIRITPDAVELRYLVDLAEIPTFQEIQDTGIVPEVGHPSLAGYLARKVRALGEGLRLTVDGRRLRLRAESSDVIFSPGAGGLPTMKLGMRFRAALGRLASPEPIELAYRDSNFPDRAGWKEIVAVAEPGVTIERRSVPEQDRSRELSDYPTDLLNSPPQAREARLLVAWDSPPAIVARPRQSPVPPARSAPPGPAPPTAAPRDTLRLEANKQATPPNRFTDLVRTRDLGFGIVVLALVTATVLGAFHALEPGHGKTVVAAYLVGARGTARHAVLLGLVVTATHTAGVYALGLVTLYGSRYVLPERVYPWLGVVSGATIALVGLILLLRRCGGESEGHRHAHHHHDGHVHHHGKGPGHFDGHGPYHPEPDAGVSVPSLVTLGVTGGIVPCPAALVVLLSALSLNRVGFGLLLIVAFSVGLAAMLVGIGVLMVYAGRVMGRLRMEGPLIRRWLPLASAAVITVVGVAITLQALAAAGLFRLRF